MENIFQNGFKINFQTVANLIKDNFLRIVIEEEKGAFVHTFLYAQLYASVYIKNALEFSYYDQSKRNFLVVPSEYNNRPSKEDFRRVYDEASLKFQALMTDFILAHEYDFLNQILEEVYDNLYPLDYRQASLLPANCPFRLEHLLTGRLP